MSDRPAAADGLVLEERPVFVFSVDQSAASIADDTLTLSLSLSVSSLTCIATVLDMHNLIYLDTYDS